MYIYVYIWEEMGVGPHESMYVCTHLCIYMGRDGSGTTRVSAPENADHHRITTTVHRKNGGAKIFFLGDCYFFLDCFFF